MKIYSFTYALVSTAFSGNTVSIKFIAHTLTIRFYTLKKRIKDLVILIQALPQSDKLYVHFKENRPIIFPIQYPFRVSHYVVILLIEGQITANRNLVKHTILKNVEKHKKMDLAKLLSYSPTRK